MSRSSRSTPRLPQRHRALPTLLSAWTLGLVGCGTADGPVAVFPNGALVQATMESTVGVLLDEFPMADRDAIVSKLMTRPESFWHDRAERQAKLTSVRLVFRDSFYDESEKKGALPITPVEGWDIQLLGKPTRRMVGTHDVLAVDYTLKSMILSKEDSPARAEPALAQVGGVWEEPFNFPVDPEQLLQRSGYACVSENQFPPNSVDSEEIDSMYDETCEVETVLSNQGCHLTTLPTESCLEALDAHIGRVETKVRFERLAYDRAVADKVRIGEVTTTKYADLTGIEEQFAIHRTIYRYIAPNSCTLVEECVGGPGWRRLLLFTGSDKNVGAQPLEIGAVDYFVDGTFASQLIDHGVFELSSCHNHYHFMHYGTFTYGDSPQGNAKRGFCLQSTNRFTNNEYGELTNPYSSCSNQGVGPGWGDEYRAGLECQWVDVTDENTRTKTVTKTLRFESNPNGFLCEGELQKDGKGDVLFTPTDFKTRDGRPVDKPVCKYKDQWNSNNVETHPSTIPLDGEGYVTQPCTHGQLGPTRNCEFKKAPPAQHLVACTPGAQVTISCTVPAGSRPQVARLCDHSAVLNTGIPCQFQESFANVDVYDGTTTEVTITCPPAKDAKEPGGKVSVYEAPLFNDDAAADVTCVVQ